MAELLRIAKATSSIHRVVSLITGNNETSRHLHEKLGFTYAGTFHQVGYKFDQWLDLCLYEWDATVK